MDGTYSERRSKQRLNVTAVLVPYCHWPPVHMCADSVKPERLQLGIQQNEAVRMPCDSVMWTISVKAV